jgi:EAL domain-containing protein (putative c-di-GMP-specific phosphodiesterase class I)
LPFDVLKIDRSFASYITEDQKDATVVSGVISIARELNMEVIVEGVETEEQLNFFIAHNCNTVQGYYYSKPLQINKIQNFLARYREENIQQLAHRHQKPLIFPKDRDKLILANKD